MVFTAYIMDKYVHNHKAVIFMESSQTEDEAYLKLGREMKKQPDHMRGWLEDIDSSVFEDVEQENKFGPLREVIEKEQDFEYVVARNPELMKLFCEYYNWLEKYGPSDDTFIHFGVRET